MPVIQPAATWPAAAAWPLAAALALAAVYALRFGFRAWREGRTVADTPTSRIRSAAQGYVRLMGSAEAPPGSEIKGPLTGIPCSWWHYRIEEKRYSGRSRQWVGIESKTSEIPFPLDDGSGRCFVDPRGAEVHAHERDVWYGPDPWPQVRIPGGTTALGRLADALLVDRYRYVEQRLTAGEPMLALGEFRTEGGAAAGDPDEETAALLHEWKRDQPALLARFDRDRDGTLSSAEWDAARAAAREQVLAARAARAPAPTVAVLADPGDGRAFLLAAVDERSLAVGLRVRALAGVAAFLAAAGAAAWVLGRV